MCIEARKLEGSHGRKENRGVELGSRRTACWENEEAKLLGGVVSQSNGSKRNRHGDR